MLAFNVPQSKAVCDGYQKSFKKYGMAKVVFSDASLASADRLQRAGRTDEGQGVDYVIPASTGTARPSWHAR